MTKKKKVHYHKDGTRCTQAEHHQHVRKREPFPSRSTLKRLVDHLVFIAGPLIPVAIAPTAYDVIFNNQTEGINLVTWGTLSFTSLVMASYAFIHRELPLILTYVPLFTLNIAIVVGVLLNA